MSTITKEWLESQISAIKAVGITDSNTLQAFEIALASLEAEPAIHRWRRVTFEPYGPYPWHYGNFIGFSKPVEGIEDEYFYSAPPAPVVPDEAYSDDCPDLYPSQPDAWAAGWNACRAVMLQGADQAPVKQPSSNSVLGWLRADYQDDNRGLRGNAPLFVLGKKDPSTVWGLDYIPLTSNSPVIPDGWALVPVEPTEDMIVNGLESEPDESFSDEKEWEAYDAMSGCQQAAHRAKLCWAAMISAAPKPDAR
ncbi:hypothetical protein V1589_15625 [Enterobacter ludwigii]|uniref:hypothetical protein n=1 Tax=Enterobacter ludwigii TaxID=299767 RepID=UPI003754722B